MSEPSGVLSVEAVLAEHRMQLRTFNSPEGCTCGEEFPAWQHPTHLAAVLSAREALVLAEGRAEAVREMTTLAEAAVIEAERAAHREQDRIERSLNLVHILGEPGVSLERVARFVAWADVHAEDQRGIVGRVILAALRRVNPESEAR